MKRILACLAILLLAGSFAAADNKVALTVKCNVSGAQVFINGRLAGYTQPNFSQLLAQGDYEITVKAKGSADYTTKIRIGRDPVIVNVNLGSPGVVTPPQITNYNLTVTANVNGADVFVNGNIAGKTPFNGQVPPGSYSVVVKAPGYNDYAENVVVRGPTRVNATLLGLTFQVSITAANVPGAIVFINGGQVGQSPYQAFLMPGSYTVTIKAPGFLDYQAQIAVNGPETVNAVLQPMTATWQFRIPEGFMNRDLRPGQSRYIELYLDGVRQAETLGPAFASGQMTAGRHTFRFVVGGLSVETQVDALAGRAYVLEPYVGIKTGF